MNITSELFSLEGISTCPGCKDPLLPHWEACFKHAWNDFPKQPTGPYVRQKYVDMPPKPTGNPKFHAMLAKMAEIHDKKSADYASSANYYSNFEQAAAAAGVTVDEVFATLIGIKLARLRELKAKDPKNESVQDSRMDLAVYSTLWASFHEGE